MTSSRPKRKAAAVAETSISLISTDPDDKSTDSDDDEVNISSKNVSFGENKYYGSDGEDDNSPSRRSGLNTRRKIVKKRRGKGKSKAIVKKEPPPPSTVEKRGRPKVEDESALISFKHQFSSWSLRDHLETFAASRSLVYRDGKPYESGLW